MLSQLQLRPALGVSGRENVTWHAANPAKSQGEGGLSFSAVI